MWTAAHCNGEFGSKRSHLYENCYIENNQDQWSKGKSLQGEWSMVIEEGDKR